MKFATLLSTLFLVLSLDAELVKLNFEIRDDDGNPIKDAVIQIRAQKKITAPYVDPGYKKMSCRTGRDGRATERFLYWGGDVYCHIEKDGYYNLDREELGITSFRFKYDVKTDTTTVLEKEKTIVAIMQRKVNPIPLYSYFARANSWAMGRNDVDVGFDLKKRDMLPPFGKGETADFYIHHVGTETNGFIRYEGELHFPENSGAYIVKSRPDLPRKIVYAADTNAVYATSFKGLRVRKSSDRSLVSEDLILNAGEALVVRSRVVTDQFGNIIKANYSKIYGPFSIAGRLEFDQTSFNPNVNDTNLEFDLYKNLSEDTAGLYHP